MPPELPSSPALREQLAVSLICAMETTPAQLSASAGSFPLPVSVSVGGDTRFHPDCPLQSSVSPAAVHCNEKPMVLTPVWTNWMYPPVTFQLPSWLMCICPAARSPFCVHVFM